MGSLVLSELSCFLADISLIQLPLMLEGSGVFEEEEEGPWCSLTLGCFLSDISVSYLIRCNV